MTQLPVGSELFGELIADLIELTNEGKIEWQAADEVIHDFEFEVDVRTWNIDLRSADGDGQVPFVLRVFNGNDLLAEVDSRVSREFNSSLTELYQIVVRQVTRVDVKLMPLIEQLRRLKDPPF